MKAFLAGLAVASVVAIVSIVVVIWASDADAPTFEMRVATDDNQPGRLQEWAPFATVAGSVFVLLLAVWGAWFAFEAQKFMRQARRAAQRVEWQPYLRVDVGPSGGSSEDFTAPKAHHISTEYVVDLAPTLGLEKKVSFSAWVRNYQNNPLGAALSITIAAGIEYKKPSTAKTAKPVAKTSWIKRLLRWILRQKPAGDQVFVLLNIITIPYCEAPKPVRVELFKIPRDWEATVSIVETKYYDLTDKRHRQRFRKKGTDAEHGRLSCRYEGGTFKSIPEARPRGEGVKFE